jgi:hypothetical protein
MQDINGIEAAKRTSATDPTVPIIPFTILEVRGSKALPERLESAPLFRKRKLGTLLEVSGSR